MQTYKLVLLRHGESQWNQENRFTGWVDVDLSATGIKEAQRAGQLLKTEGLDFDWACTSILKRAIRTLWIALAEMDRMWLPIHHSWRLNERHYGALQGLDKAETAAKYGDAQVLQWRRSYDTPPPPLSDEEFKKQAAEPRFRTVEPQLLPRAEALKQTSERMMPLWHETLAPQIRNGKKLLITAHGNSLRALVQYLDQMSAAEIMELNIPTGTPLVYELDQNLKPVSKRYLGDQAEIAKAINAVKSQAQKK